MQVATVDTLYVIVTDLVVEFEELQLCRVDPPEQVPQPLAVAAIQPVHGALTHILPLHPQPLQCLFTLMDFPSFIILFAASLEIVLASERSMITCLQAIRGFVISISTGNYQLHLSGSGQHVTNILSLKGIVRQRTLL